MKAGELVAHWQVNWRTIAIALTTPESARHRAVGHSAVEILLGDSVASTLVSVLRGSNLTYCRNVWEARAWTASDGDQAVCRSAAEWRTSLPATM
jgi:hypothetical protein